MPASPSATVTAATPSIATRFIPTPSRNCTMTAAALVLASRSRSAKATNSCAKPRVSTRNASSASPSKKSWRASADYSARWPMNSSSAGSARTRASCNSRSPPSRMPAGICGPRRAACRCGSCCSISRLSKSSPRWTSPISTMNSRLLPHWKSCASNNPPALPAKAY